jgi:hypothetical protein
MGIYNKIMLYFWLAMGIVIVAVVTFMGIQSGFDRWYHFYIFGVISFFMYFVRRWMMKRMQKHMAFLEEQQKGKDFQA